MKKTFNELMNIDQLVGQLYKQDAALRDTKFAVAFEAFAKENLTKPIEEYQKELGRLRLEYALETDKGAIVFDKDNSRGYAYTKEKFTQLLEAEEAFITKFGEKEFDVTPCIASFVPENLTEDQKAMLAGVLIPA